MIDKLREDFRNGRPRALSRLISLAENGDAAVTPLLAELFEKVGRARVVGITGPPGAGKSSLTNAFVGMHRRAGARVGVVAVDPVSPFTGGALLGDRIRLTEHFNDPGVFIRSLSTRGKLGGLSLATREVVHALDAFGFENVLIETVGVGQSEVDIRKVADLTMVVLVPEWGDGVQALKAGVLEIGDIFVVNKADREGAERVVQELKNALHMAGRDDLPVLTTSIQDEASVRKLFETVDGFYASHAALVAERRKGSVQATMIDLLEARVLAEAHAWVARQKTAGTNPYRFMLDLEKAKPFGSLLPT